MNAPGNRINRSNIGANSNAKLTYQIGGMIAFILILGIIIYFIVMFYKDYNKMQSNEPYLVEGTKVAQTAMTVPGNKILNSIDSKYGMEFTYSMWLYINDWTYKNDEYKHILHKGNGSAQPILQAPGLWLYPRENKIAINMNTYYSVKESCDIGNIPIAKWFNLIIVLVGRNLDVYINGQLKKRCRFRGVPKLNFGDVYINQWNGFDGFMSNVRYFNFAIPYFKVEQLMAQGPSQATCVDASVKPPYFAKNYWFNTGFPDALGFPGSSNV